MRAPRGLKRQRGYFWAAIPYVLSAIASAGSSVYSSQTAARESRSSAREQMAFQERMRGTQYSVAMEDMRRAGLNPMLAYQQGGAGGAPGAGYSADYSGVTSSAQQSLRMLQELQLLKTQVDKTKSDIDVNKEVVKEIGARVANTNVSTALAQTELPKARTRAQLESSKPGKVITTFERIMEALGSVFGKNSGRPIWNR